MNDDYDPLEPIQTAVFTALDTGLAADLTTVFVHLPQDTRPPITVIGAMSTEDQGDKDSDLELVTFEVAHIYRGTSRAQLLAMMRAARGLLHRQRLTAAGVTLSRIRIVRSEVSDGVAGHPDGITYAGLQTFEAWAQPA